MELSETPDVLHRKPPFFFLDKNAHTKSTQTTPCFLGLSLGTLKWVTMVIFHIMVVLHI